MLKRFKKAGFTIVELVVVIAIIAVLTAVIAPGLNTGEANRDAAASAAGDFYAATQNLFTKYSKFEAPLSAAMKSEETIMKYYAGFGGNYPVDKYLFLHVETKSGNVVSCEVTVASDTKTAITKVLDKESTTLNTAFGKTFSDNLEPLIELKNGHYYALVEFVNNSSILATPMVTSTVRVMCTGYTENQLPPVGSAVYTDYVAEYMTFMESNRLANHQIFGVCSSVMQDVGSEGKKVMGQRGTRFGEL